MIQKIPELIIQKILTGEFGIDRGEKEKHCPSIISHRCETREYYIGFLE
jgi:hypothetical protein